MTAPTWHSTPDARDYDDIDSDNNYVTPELLAGERIGEPLPRTGRQRLLRRSAAAALAAGGGWAYWTEQVSVPPWLTDAATGAVSAAMKSAPPVVERKVTEAAKPSVPEIMKPLPTVEVAATPGTDPAAAPTAPAAEDAAESRGAEPLPPPKAGKADPYAQRAAAVGLHPDLSRVLLEKMTAADYKNAGIAIKTALAEIPDSEVYTWPVYNSPKERKLDAALFEVRFVAGAPSGCRRYVVAVSKDGWLTTALPLEKCGKGVKTASVQ